MGEGTRGVMDVRGREGVKRKFKDGVVLVAPVSNLGGIGKGVEVMRG